MAPGPASLDSKLALLFDEPAMMIAATRATDGRPAIARVMGARRRQDAGLDLMVAAGQWPEFAEGLAAGGQIAFTLCRPSDYETYQLKGPARPPIAAGEADRAFAADYIAATTAELRRLGATERQMACWLSLEGLVRIAFAPQNQFAQTPGPGAGRAIGAMAPAP